MHRRTLLAAAGISMSTALAGCTEDSSNRESGDGGGDGSGGGDDGSGGGGSDDPVQFIDHEWYNDGAFDAGVTGQLENVSGDQLSYVEVTAYFLDEEGTQFEESLDNTSDLAAGRTWEFDAMFLGDDPSRVDNYEVEWNVTNY